jgi:hypothetical protein
VAGPGERGPAEETGPRPGRRRRRARTALFWFAAGPLLLGGPLLALSSAMIGPGQVLYDFKGGLLNAGVAILHGVSPYRPVFLAHQTAIMRAGGIALGETAAHPFSIPVYPALPNLLAVPLALLPVWAAGTLYTLATIAAMGGGLWLLGARDWRCFAVAAISWPFEFGLYLGAVGPFLVLGAGVAWRWRDRLWPPALGVAAIVALKIFPWTLAVWLLVTRRRRAFALTVAACALLTFGAWAVIGFDGLAAYPRMLSDVSFLQEGRAMSLVNLLLVAGVSPGAATAGALLAAAAILLAAWRVAGGPDGDRRAFSLAIMAAMTGTPIVWEHYMVLLFVPIALTSPGWSRLWLVPAITPVLRVLSYLVVGDASRVQAYSPNALRGTIPWLAAELVIGVAAGTTADQRARTLAGVRRALRAPAGRAAARPAPELG